MANEFAMPLCFFHNDSKQQLFKVKISHQRAIPQHLDNLKTKFISK